MRNLMVIAVLFLTVFNNETKACSQVSVAELNSCTVEDRFFNILNKLRPGVEYNIEEKTDELDVRSIYERLTMTGKPSLVEMQTELDAWKDSKRPAIQFKESLKGLKYGRVSAAKCGFGRPNYKLLLRDMIRDLDQTKLDCLISEEAKAEADKTALEDKMNQLETIKASLKDANCGPMTGFQKQVCRYFKLSM